jgi:hypothetical protein
MAPRCNHMRVCHETLGWISASCWLSSPLTWDMDISSLSSWTFWFHWMLQSRYGPSCALIFLSIYSYHEFSCLSYTSNTHFETVQSVYCFLLISYWFLSSTKLIYTDLCYKFPNWSSMYTFVILMAHSYLGLSFVYRMSTQNSFPAP